MTETHYISFIHCKKNFIDVLINRYWTLLGTGNFLKIYRKIIFLNKSDCLRTKCFRQTCPFCFRCNVQTTGTCPSIGTGTLYRDDPLDHGTLWEKYPVVRETAGGLYRNVISKDTFGAGKSRSRRTSWDYPGLNGSLAEWGLEREVRK